MKDRLCADCGREIQTHWCLKIEPGTYWCWNCVNDRRFDTEEEFDLGV